MHIERVAVENFLALCLSVEPPCLVRRVDVLLVLRSALAAIFSLFLLFL